MREQPEVYRFDGFSLEVAERRLLTRDEEIHLRPKTFDTLLYLVSRHGHLVTKEELLDAVWKDVAVTENAMTRCIKEVRQALGDNGPDHRFVKTVHKSGYKFISAVSLQGIPLPEELVVEEIKAERIVETEITAEISGNELQAGLIATSANGHPLLAPPGSQAFFSRSRRIFWGGVFVILLAGVSAGFFFYRQTSPPSFSQRDWVLITDFENSAGQPVLNSALRIAIENELTRSQYLNVVPLSRVLDTLRLMKRPAETPITEQLGREICLRDGGIRVMLAGGIRQIGGTYQIGIRVVDPASGAVIAVIGDQAPSSAGVLPALGRLASKVRESLGESKDLIAQSTGPKEQATTSSLEALDFFRKGRFFDVQFLTEQAIFNYSQAIELDSSFAEAYFARGRASLLAWYLPGIGEKAQADLNRAAGLAESENIRLRERLLIQSWQALYCQGNLPRAIELGELLRRQFPDYSAAHEILFFGYLAADDLERAEQQYQYLLRLLANSAGTRGGHAWFLFKFKADLEEAAIESRQTRELNPGISLETLYIAEPFRHLWRGEFAEAEDQANEVFEKKLSSITPAFQIPIRRYLAVIFTLLGDFEKALSLLETREKWPPQFSRVKPIPGFDFKRAAIYRQMGQTEKSRRLLNAEATHSIGVAKIEILGRLGCEAVQSRDWNEVEKVIAEIRAETRLPPVNFLEPPLVWKLDRAKRCWSALLEGKLALGKGQLDLAIVGLEDCRRVILADSPGHDGLQALTAWVQTNLSLAGAYDQKGDIARAIPCLQFVLDKKAHLIKDSWETMDYFQAMQSMISLLEKTGRRVEADRYRMEKRNFRPGNR